ncbi:hypothetical protein C8R45DRAFT_1017459 [Mycena sanguinolenta]|nr:hypothetical protein C8R45DRAFT_1017459 [Mycena sanguinolenta]
MTILYVADFSDPEGEAVKVTIPAGDDITALKKLILAEWGTRGHSLAAGDIRLWKPNRRIREDQIATVLKESCLPGIATRLALGYDVNLLAPRTRSNCDIDVIAEVVLSQRGPISPPPDEPEEERDTIGAMNSRYRNLVQNARESKSPSQSAKSTNYRQVQSGDYPIYDGRYNHTHGGSTMAPPIQLYNPAFAHFLDDAANPALEVPDKVVLATADLMRRASAIYDDENTRRSKIRPALKNAISYGITQLISDDRTTPDGVVMWTMSGTDGSLNEAVALLIEEEKRELGEGGCDASTQASFSMLKYWAQSNNDAVRGRCCCPTFLIAFAGPWLAILGAVLTDKCIVQRLTDFMWLGSGAVLTDSKQCLRVARVLHSLTRSLGHLRNYYVTLTSSNDPEPSRFFPSPTSFLSSGASVQFEYLQALERDAVCVTFLCRTQEEQPRSIVVKFAQTYCPEAHELLAQKGLAPQLLYCGPVVHSDDAPSYQLLKMIVMEYIDGRTVAQLEGKLPDDFAEQVTKIVSILHNDGYVFGDLRWPNVMVVGKEIKLIDFDWAGKQGRASYPIHLAHNIDWPPGVTAMGKIEKEHDMYMLKSLIGSCTKLT